VAGDATALPFEDASFDRISCRQGIQFMDDAKAVAEMFRVLKPGGRVVLVHLCAYGDADRDEYFEVLRLRNPARRNFYTRERLAALLHDRMTESVVPPAADAQALAALFADLPSAVANTALRHSATTWAATREISLSICMNYHAACAKPWLRVPCHTLPLFETMPSAGQNAHPMTSPGNETSNHRHPRPRRRPRA
jgi:SAM-dependent methyltransferase